jgi:hypothetical protein
MGASHIKSSSGRHLGITRGTYAVGSVSYEVAFIPNFLTIDSGFQVILRLQYLRFSQRWLWRMPSSGMWRRVDLVWTDVSEERIAPTFRVEQSASEEPVCCNLLTQYSYLHGATSQKTIFFNIKVITSTIWQASVLVLAMEGTYEALRWGDLGWHDIHTKFHDERFRLWSNIKLTDSMISEAGKLVLLMGGIYEVSRWYGFRWPARLCIPNFINIGTGGQSCWGAGAVHTHTHTHTELDDFISLVLFFQNKRNRPNYCYYYYYYYYFYY